ncbi:MAG TPA: GTPase HflX [Syntrophomonadaceae bacterium]|nr:GTPase HflX [Syntrophomonadaceae bacterium]
MTIKTERAILVGVKGKSRDSEFDSSFQELQGLVKAAGGVVITSVVQAQDHTRSSTYIGKGKVEEVQRLVQEEQPDLVVFNQELSPVQLRNLEETLEVKIVDRTMLILDIFAQRARSREGQLQVELATLEYRLPRLTGMGRELSRLGGGIGTRGAGEQKLELDRRYIRRRIRDIRQQIEKVKTTRELHRKRRQRAGIREVSLVGYTNAGKSSLFNALCRIGHSSGQDQADADSRLFQTLDTTTRKIGHLHGEQFLLTDTVGFIQNLPHHLIQAFRATLEEAIRADLILHVMDVSDPDYLEKMATVEKVLDNLGAEPGRIIPVFTKIDLLPEARMPANGTAWVSGQTGQGTESLLNSIAQHLGQVH